MLLPAVTLLLLFSIPEQAWHDDGNGAQSITLREDAQTGAVELLARYPAGHAFRPHSHPSNERIVMLEGNLHLHIGDENRDLDPGDYAYIPATQQHAMNCASTTRCQFYVHWDGKLH